MFRPTDFFLESLVITAPRHALRRWPGIAAVGLHALLGGGMLARGFFTYEKLDAPEAGSRRISGLTIPVRIGDGQPAGHHAASQTLRTTRVQTQTIDRTRIHTPTQPTPRTQPTASTLAIEESSGSEEIDGKGTGGRIDGNRDSVVPDDWTFDYLDIGPPIGDHEAPPIEREYGLTVSPRLKSKVEPSYPDSARRMGVEGTVVMELIVDENGNVLDARILRSDDAIFNEPALRAARQWKYTAGEIDGRKVRTYKSATIHFTLH